MKKKMLYAILFAALIVGVFILFSAKQPVMPPSPSPSAGSDSESGWTKHSQNPIASFYTDIPGLKVFADPSVLVEDGLYKMWFGCNNGEVTQVCHATSEDGLKWKARLEPVLKLGMPGAWDDYSSEVPTVMKDGNLYKMWYAGYSRAIPDQYNIGYATSPDGIRWTRLPAKDSPHGKEGLVLMYDNSREGEINTIADPAVVKVNGTYHLWYNGFGIKMIAISHAISKDGIHWERDSKNPVLIPSKPWEMVGDEGSVTQPHVLWDGTQFEIWYGSFADEYQRYTAISHATSPNGTTWTKDSAPAILPGPEDLWTGMSVIRVGNEVRLYYIGFPKLGAPTQLYLATRRIASVVPQVVSKGDRILSIAITLPKDGDYEKAFNLAKAAGMDQPGELHFEWNKIEERPMNYENQFLSIANTYYPAINTKITLTISPIHTNQLVVPDDLKSLAFDDPVLIERFKKMLDWVFIQIPNLELNAFVIGNEFDIYLGDDETKWRQFIRFYEAVRAYAKTKRPGLQVGAEATFGGLTGENKTYSQELNKKSDFIGVSYYPTKDDFTVEEPKVVHADFKKLTSIYPKPPIYFFQYGYPDSSKLNSSETKQREFIAETFRAWDNHRDQIRMITFTWLHDLPPESVEFFKKFYGISLPSFAEFLATLGLRTYNDKDKPAFQALKAEAKARGWKVEN